MSGSHKRQLSRVYSYHFSHVHIHILPVCIHIHSQVWSLPAPGTPLQPGTTLFSDATWDLSAMSLSSTQNALACPLSTRDPWMAQILCFLQMPTQILPLLYRGAPTLPTTYSLLYVPKALSLCLHYCTCPVLLWISIMSLMIWPSSLSWTQDEALRAGSLSRSIL